MNEKIRALAEQAGYKPLPGFDFANSLEEIYLEKFAELIVRECAGILDKMSGLPDDTGGNAYLAAGSKKIRQHFGVDE